MKKIISNILLGVFISSVSFTAVAQPKTLDELLEVVRKGAIAESSEYKKREREFLQAKQRQQQLLSTATNTRAAEERRSEELEASFNKQEEDLAQLTELLTRRLGSLRELFGVLQQVAGDTRGKFETSITSAQLPGRSEFLANLAKKMGTSTELATIPEIERVVYEIQREMTESGKIVNFNATVIEADGNQVEKQVTRVGAFNLVTDGKYLEYDPETGAISELVRQPSRDALSTTSAIVNADSGYVRFALDPSRGSILSLLVQAPSWLERATQQGGAPGWIIIALGAVGLLLALVRWVSLGTMGRKVKSQIASETTSENNPLGRVLTVHEKNKDVDTETLELKMHEAILKEMPSITRYINVLKIIAVVAPLLGLLGTVIGMINTFQAITLFGAGDPKLMAGGISQALVTTMLGLFVAIPMTLIHSFVSARSKGIVHVLEEQSAGIIAAHNEKTRT